MVANPVNPLIPLILIQTNNRMTLKTRQMSRQLSLPLTTMLE